MKIGIITFHETTNFGSTLQAYGLYYAISKIGVDCEFIDYKCQAIVDKELPKRISFTMSLKEMAKYLLFHKANEAKFKSLKEFIEDNAKLSIPYTKDTIKNSVEKYDRIIVGSDIVWGLDITRGDTTYFLDFVTERSKKYAFSSSVGNQWNISERSVVKPLLEDFSRIAVREEESADWIQELIGIRPPVVCDPTMLLTSGEWLEYKSDTYKNHDYVLAYFDNDNHDCIKAAVKLAKIYGCKVLFINYGRPFKGVKSVRPSSIADFFSLIYYSKKVVTASYHGMLFSIYFNKQFVYFNRAHKSRMNTLANKLNVTMCDGDGKDVLLIPEIDFDIVNQKVEEYRKLSMRILSSYLTEK